MAEFENLCSGKQYDLFVSFIQQRGVDRDTAEDLVQESLLRAWEQREQFRGESALTTWVYSIGWNKLLSHFRRQKLMEKFRAIQRLHTPVFDAMTILFSQEILDVLREQLSDNHFRVLYLDACERYSNTEISNILGVRLGTIKTRLHHARRQAAHVLTEAGYNVSISS